MSSNSNNNNNQAPAHPRDEGADRGAFVLLKINIIKVFQTRFKVAKREANDDQKAVKYAAKIVKEFLTPDPTMPHLQCAPLDVVQTQRTALVVARQHLGRSQDRLRQAKAALAAARTNLATVDFEFRPTETDDERDERFKQMFEGVVRPSIVAAAKAAIAAAAAAAAGQQA